MLDPGARSSRRALKGERNHGLTRARARSPAADLRRPLEPRDRREARSQRQHRGRAPREHHEYARHAQDRRARGLRASSTAWSTCREPARVPASRRRGAAAGARRCAATASRAQAPAPLGSGWSTSPPRPGSSSGITTAASAASCCPKRWAPAAPSSTTTATAGRTSCSSTAWTGPATAPAIDATAVPQQPQRHVLRRHAKRGPRRRDVRHGRGRRRFQQRRLSRSADYLRRAEPVVPQHRQGNFVDATRASGLAGARPSAPRRCGSTSTAMAFSTCSSAITSSGSNTW